MNMPDISENKSSRARNNNAKEYERALEKMNEDSPDLAMIANYLQIAADKGDPRAHYALGTWYLHGRFFKKNLRKAIAFIRYAAEREIPDALFDLAVCYEKGVGVPRKQNMAMELYLRAALAGEKKSLYEVGRCYYYGIGTEKNTRIANIWLDHARKQGIEE
jgi:TPR repeat protein